MTGRVQFRESQATLDELRARGINPNDLARDLFAAEVRRMRAEERHAKLRQMEAHMPPGGGAAMVREDREGRERWRPAGL